VTRSYCPARCFSVRISSTEQFSIIFTPGKSNSNDENYFHSFLPLAMANRANVKANGTGSTIKSFGTQRPP
jgi:hypothetical protein